MKVIVTGATGLIGRHLVAALAARGDAVTALSRNDAVVPGARTVRWTRDEPLPAEATDGADAIVNLAGAGIGDHRWTTAYKRELFDSRIGITRRCVDALGDGGPRILVNGSAMGYYGDRGEDVADEDTPPGTDFLASLCVAWEDEARRGEERGARVVRLRTAHVLAPGGGLLGRLLLPARLGLGGPMGSGRQWQSWIHVADECGLIILALTSELSGPVNAASPNPVRQREFAQTLGKVLHRPAFMPLPGFVLRLGLGEVGGVALAGQRLTPRAALEAGYEFRFATLEDALRDVAGRR